LLELMLCKIYAAHFVAKNGASSGHNIFHPLANRTKPKLWRKEAAGQSFRRSKAANTEPFFLYYT
jgi:hypothetical protein